jgi:3-dehydrosphinganine reductase
MHKGQNIIITGGSSGLGKALARRFAQEGASLALIARDITKLEATQKELQDITSPSQKVSIYSCDVSDFPSVESTIAAIADELGPPQALINSAGILREGYFEKVPLETFREVMDINYYGTLHCIKAVLPYFKRQGSGRIVNICSTGGRFGAFGYSAYCSSKYAVLGLTETLRCELKPQNIRLQVVCPPEFESPMVDEINKCRTPENLKHVHTMPVLDAETVADAVMESMDKGRYLTIPGRMTRLIDLANRLLPAISRQVVDFQIKSVYRGPE